MNFSLKLLNDPRKKMIFEGKLFFSKEISNFNVKIDLNIEFPKNNKSKSHQIIKKHILTS